ncbi:MAG: tetratricopeptide repeat protein [Chitinophagaceae bacterium]|nr:MAG: tetratricopeptide repeat protein [Chitinophagaceae bacterium]
MKKILIPIVLLACTLRASACINGETRELKDGTVLFADPGDENRVPRGHAFNDINYGRVMASLEAGWRRTGHAEYRSDMGVLLILQKKYSEARNLYLELERSKPGRYSTASNLGTVYELMGRNDSALHWIRRAVAINPASHKGSEWIHVNILEAKVAGKTDPATAELLDIDFGTDARPAAPRQHASYAKLDEALSYQLSERMSFIAPPDPVIGRLLFELGNVRWLQGDLYSVPDVYAAAQRYGFRDTLLTRRLARIHGELRAKLAGDTTAQAIGREEAADTARFAYTTNPEAGEAPKVKRREGLFWAVGAGFLLLLGFVGFLFGRRTR